jgi:NarL family two-component system response regulator LiaR
MEETIMNQSPVRVLIVDDHQVVRDGLKLMLSVSPGMACVGEAENGDEAIRMCAELMPDVVLMDLIMPITDGVSATRIIRQQHPNAQVVVLTTFDDKDLVQKALRAGAISYMLKNASMETITNTIRDAAVGRSTISASAIQSLIQVEEDETPGQVLSDREKEILVLMADGLKSAAIAEKLYISEATVRFHASNILRKLGAANRAQAVRIAFERRLIN